MKDTPDNAITDAKYFFIQGALRETLHHHVTKPGRTLTEKIDSVVTNRFLGFPLFFVLLFFIFYVTFEVGSYPMDWIDWLVSKISDFVNYSMPPSMLKDLIVDGAISGVGAVIIFLPNILILYFFISILEDSGYMARAAFIMDKLMHKMGLHGKSFIPMIMGFGCNVPAIMAVRTIESRKSRLITMLVIPMMSCSARIPVFIVLIGAFFPQYGAWMMMGLYALGIVLAVIMSRLFSKFLVRDDQLPFVMELPPYRIPTYKAVFRHTWEKGRQYLRKMGGIILIFSVIIWALNYFPLDNTETHPVAEQASVAQVDHVVSPDSQKVTEGHQSYLEQIGRFIAPVFAPMDFDWKMSVGILSGVGAKELVVSTLAVMYAGEDFNEDQEGSEGYLREALVSNISHASAFAYLIFVLLYFPCFATIVAIKNESGGWKWAIFAAVYTSVLAYIVSLIAYLIVA